tara:strand:+ start:525101 stop:525880 length:780 start_codon:yes stop_codon:yes gene_type:complete
MTRSIIAVAFASVFAALTGVSLADDAHQYYEVRSYLLSEKSDTKAIDTYLEDALLPALQRQGIGPIGVFTNAPSDESGSPRIVVVIPYDSPNQIATVKKNVAADADYQSAAEPLLGRQKNDAAYDRIQSELLVAMDCMPKLNVTSESLSNSNRVYELRLYESPTEKLGDLKVDMFNNGEVPIFYDCGIQPVFIGQGLIGPQTPNLTYLTTYPSDAARLKAWEAFKVNPDWQVLKVVEKYKGTVSKIDKFVLMPKPYSQM